MKICRTCTLSLPEQAFSLDRAKKDGLRPYCKACDSQRQRAYRSGWSSERKAQARAARKVWLEQNLMSARRGQKCATLRLKYGITADDLDGMFRSQCGLCLLCEMRKPLRVDHDHQTGEIRGLLCHNCNTGLGHFRENTNLMAKAISYLEG